MKPMSVTSFVESLPGNLLSAEALHEQLRERGVEITVDRLLELANAYYIPHYRVDGGPPLFSMGEAKKWIAKNLSQRIDGQPIPKEFKVLVQALPGELTKPLPMSLTQIGSQLIEMATVVSVCGVYFLCDLGEVVYVGQSVCTGARIGTHAQSGKKFDRAYILPLPPDRLDSAEGAFIRALKPKYNIGCPCESVPDSDTFINLGVEVTQ